MLKTAITGPNISTNEIPPEKMKAIEQIKRMLFENLHTAITLSALPLDEDAQLVLFLDIERQAKNMQFRLAEKKARREAAILHPSRVSAEKEPAKSIDYIAAAPQTPTQDIATQIGASLTSTSKHAGIFKPINEASGVLSSASASAPTSPDRISKKEGEAATRRRSDPGTGTPLSLLFNGAERHQAAVQALNPVL